MCSSKVLGIVYLGNGTDGVSVTTSSQRLFFGPLEQSNRSWDLLDSELNIIAWGHRKPYSLHEETSSKGQPERNKCFLGGTPFFKQYKFHASHVKGVSFSLHQENCPLGNTKWNKILPLPERKVDMKLDRTLQEWNPDKPFICPNSEEMREAEANCDSKYGKDTLIGHLDTVDEQSAKVALMFQAHIFNNLELPEIKSHEWKVFQLAKMIFDAVCPKTLVPEFFFNHLIILFRYLLVESMRKNIVHDHAEMDNETYSRIETALHNCILGAREFSFVNDSNTCLSEVRIITI